MIPASIASLFSRGIQARGAEYEAEGHVLLISPPPSIRATVAGSIDYTVWIDVAPGRRWAMSCSCPFAHDRGICKHIWAALLAADKLGYLGGGVSSAADARARPVPEWKRRLHALRARALPEPDHAAADAWPDDRRIIYLLVLDETARMGDAVVDVMSESIAESGASAPFSFSREAWLRASDPADRQIAHLLLGTNVGGGFPQAGTHRHRFVIPAAMYETTLRAICESGRCYYSMSARGSRSPTPVTWDDGPPWSVQCRVLRDPDRGGWRLDGVIQRPGEQLPLEDVEMMTDTGLLLTATKVARLEAEGARSLFPLLDPRAPLIVRDEELFDLVAELHLLPSVPKIELPDGVRVEHARPIPTPHLRIGAEPYGWAGRDRLVAELHFDYDGHHVPFAKRGRPIVDAAGKRIVHRNPEFEKSALKRVLGLGVRREEAWETAKPELVVPPKLLAELVQTLTDEGWHVDAEGKRYRTADRTTVNVSSGIDWFELYGTAEFGDQQVPLPRLLDALRRRERSVLLDDGTHGLLPEEWLARFARIAALTTESADGESIRFTLAQTALLDALLATLPEPRVDETFARIRDELRGFDAITPADPPSTFTGTLRGYQREGLGWMLFLRRFALGGCLADDMGLGKTVQVLALLERMRVDGAGPSLLVVPKSLVFNWQREAARFTPQLRVRDYTGSQRRRAPLDTSEFDLLVTTYGTLRRDAPQLREIEFEYCVLDEAQAIKNARTASAKAARLLRARHRLAMSGTPIENRVEELWSIFDFLNPGMLGASSALSAIKSTDDPTTNGAGRTLVARALRPFILRRTKEQVAPELPARLEQTLIVELEKDQRMLYDELRLHYRRALLPRVDQLGTQRTQFEILEALLRLRQAACHPGLIDAAKADLPSAKLDVLVSQLTEIVAEGHKALVFSQFTSFLAIVRTRLDAEGVVYEYLDGKTTDRQQRVERFQSDAACPVFLISLRAGGYGLNLTAADYVFLLDPWWNPAVEAQAIDRTHRIGQERQVFAMRLIARDTVEEKVLALQQKKRELVDAILNAEAGGLAAIKRDDLEMLLG